VHLVPGCPARLVLMLVLFHHLICYEQINDWLIDWYCTPWLSGSLKPETDCPVGWPVISGANCFVIRHSLAKLVRRTQHRHRCVDIRIVLNRIAATIPMTEEDKDDSNDNKMAAMFTLRWLATKESVGRAVPATRATPRMRSSDNVCQSRPWYRGLSGDAIWRVRMYHTSEWARPGAKI